MECYRLVKCDFCNIGLRTDLEVSTHLISERHKSRLNEYFRAQPEESDLEACKQWRRKIRANVENITDLFRLLRLRSASDVMLQIGRAHV